MVETNHFLVVFLLYLAAGLLHAWGLLNPTELAVNTGENVTLPCFLHGEKTNSPVMWVKEDRSERMSQWWVEGDGSLSLSNVSRHDSGEYTCALEDENESNDMDTLSGHDLIEEENSICARYKLTVRTAPGGLANVSVHPSTVLALLLWEIGDTGGCEISHFTARYRQLHATAWLDVLPKHISPTTRQIDVYHLTPNSTYVFQIWATNEVGAGERVSLEATTKHVDQEIELARHLLQGVETFDTRVWVVAVSVVMGTLLVLSIATCYLMFRDYHISMWSNDDQEVMELVPNIILNPGFHEDGGRTERRVPDENCNDQLHVAFNNNSIVRPMRV